MGDDETYGGLWLVGKREQLNLSTNNIESVATNFGLKQKEQTGDG